MRETRFQQKHSVAQANASLCCQAMDSVAPTESREVADDLREEQGREGDASSPSAEEDPSIEVNENKSRAKKVHVPHA